MTTSEAVTQKFARHYRNQLRRIATRLANGEEFPDGLVADVMAGGTSIDQIAEAVDAILSKRAAHAESTAAEHQQLADDQAQAVRDMAAADAAEQQQRSAEADERSRVREAERARIAADEREAEAEIAARRSRH